MRIFNIIAIFMYSLLFCMIGAILIALSLRTESITLIINMLGYLSGLHNVKLIMALIGLLLILINISIAQLTIGKLQKHKTIAFSNPHGQVTVSLTSVEDYIKKLTHKMPEIKEIKSNVSAVKSGIEVIIKAILYSDVNIPEVTDKIQNTIRFKLQEILGLEENINIKIHVSKIVQKHSRLEKSGVEEEMPPSGFKGEIKYGK